MVRINGYNISELTHNEVIQFLKAKKSVSLKVKCNDLTCNVKRVYLLSIIFCSGRDAARQEVGARQFERQKSV